VAGGRGGMVGVGEGLVVVGAKGGRAAKVLSSEGLVTVKVRKDLRTGMRLE